MPDPNPTISPPPFSASSENSAFSAVTTPHPTSTQTPSPPQTPTSPPHHSQSKVPLLLGLVVLVLGLLGGGFYLNLIQLPTLKPPQSYEECLATPGSIIQESYPQVCVTKSGARFTQPLPSPSPVADPTANWQTYIDQAVEYSFKYPNEYIVVEDSEEYFNEQGANLPQSFIELAGYTPPTKISAIRVESKNNNSIETYPIFNVWIFENPQNLNTAQWQEKYKGFYPFHWGEGDPGFTKGNMSIAGLDTEYSSIEGMAGKSTHIYLQKGQSIFLFSLLETSNSMNLANLILSTFKFSQ